jgi:hypothetical protein
MAGSPQRFPFVIKPKELPGYPAFNIPYYISGNPFAIYLLY